MHDSIDDTQWIHVEVWLDVGERRLVRAQARQLCLSGAFIEYTGPVQDRCVQVIIPPLYNGVGGNTVDGFDTVDALQGGHRTVGLVAKRLPDGIWVRFSRELRSLSDVLIPHRDACLPLAA